MSRRWFLLCLSLCMVLVMLPFTVGAAADEMTWSALKSALESGQNVTLTNSITRDREETIEIDKQVTLDLNGQVLAGNTYETLLFAVRNDGALTITDSSMSKDGAVRNVSNYIVFLAGGQFTLENGSLCDSQGGVYVYSGDAVMTGGSISGCTSSDYDLGYGYGVYDLGNTYGSFTMTGGSISGCTVGVREGSDLFKIKLGGTASIINNVKANVWLIRAGSSSIEPLYVVSAFDADARIGVSAYEQNDGNGNNPIYGTFTSGLSQNGDVSNFVSDYSGYGVVIDEDGEAELHLPFNVSVETYDHVTLTIDKQTAVAGEEVSLDIECDTSYLVTAVYLNGTLLTENDAGLSECSFPLPGYDVTVSADISQIPVPYVDADGVPQTPLQAYSLVTSGQLSWNAEWYVVGTDVTFDKTKVITVNGDVNLLLCDGTSLVSGTIYVPEGSKLTIWAQENGTGSLSAESEGGEDYRAGIGMRYNPSTGYATTGDITINGGTIYAKGKNYAPGIGECYRGGRTSNVTINGGNITAVSTYQSAAIGGQVVTINGGVIDVEGDPNTYLDISAPTVVLNYTDVDKEIIRFRKGFAGTLTLNRPYRNKVTGEVYSGGSLAPYTGEITLIPGTALIVKPASIEGLSFQAYPEYCLAGDTVTLTYTEWIGYTFVDWVVKDASGDPVQVTDNHFVMPDTDVTVEAVVTKPESIPYVNADQEAMEPVTEYSIIQTFSRTWNTGWYVVYEDVRVDGQITVNGNVNLILCDGATLTAPEGIHVCTDQNLTIWAQEEGTGALVAVGNVGGAGIGSEVKKGCGSITINGGSIDATGGTQAAGIGSTYSYNLHGVITINGGSVRAQGGNQSAGIGIGRDGRYSENAKVVINGGEVTAIAGTDGAGIGGGYYCGGVVEINGGIVNATSNGKGAAIGGGSGYATVGAGTVTITGGQITATCTGAGAGIGCGANSGRGSVYITYNDSSDPLSITASSIRGDNVVVAKALKNSATGALIRGSNSAIDGATKAMFSGATMVPADVYTVSFDANGASGQMTSVEVIEGDEYVLPDPTFTAPEGSAFAGWICSSDNQFYHPDEKISVFEDITLQAIWRVAGQTYEPVFTRHSMILSSGEIGVNFFMDLSMLDESVKAESYMTFTIGFSNKETEKAYNAGFMNSTGDYYGFTCNVNAIQMADTITATYHYKENGTEKTVSNTYTVVEYIDAVVNSLSTTKKDKDLVKALKDYGYHAQQYLSEVRGWELGTDYTAIEKPYTSSYSQDDMDRVATFTWHDERFIKDVGSSGLRITYSLVLDSRTAIYLYVDAPDAYKENMSATVDGNPAEMILQGDGRYRIEISGIRAQNLQSHHSVKIKTADGSTQLATVDVCGYSYVASCLDNKNNYSAKEKRLAMALYRYGEIAQEYVS
ncbi:MAG: InlB B-repeat-containing protein [Clostridiales bacterium]|nr:InlB B-repeat-containing protein [Clostridiales bacterium]